MENASRVCDWGGERHFIINNPDEGTPRLCSSDRGVAVSEDSCG